MVQKYLREFAGTFGLVFVGCGTAAQMSPDNATAMIIVGIAFFLILAILLYMMTNLNANPAVSLALAMDGQITGVELIGFWTAQFLGAIAAAALLMFILGRNSNLGASIGSLTNTQPWRAAFVEGILTFIFVLTILSVSSQQQYTIVAGLIIALALGMGVMFGYNLTGGSLNPARSLGPAIFTNNLGTIWIYFLGPLLGAIVAFLCYKYIQLANPADNQLKI